MPGNVAVGKSLREWRRSQGLDRQETARRLHRASGGPRTTTLPSLTRMIGSWERGEHELSERYELAYRQLGWTGVPDSADAEPEVPDDGTAGDAWRTALAWLASEPPHMASAAAGGHEGAEAAVEIESRVHELRLLDDRLGGADTMGDAERELERTRHVISAGRYSQATGQRLYAALADLHQIVGWIASDAGRYEHAERLYLDGVNAAHTARNDLAAGSLLSSLAYQVANTGRPDDAVLLARAAVRGAAGAGGRPRALLLERLAWASARAGDHYGTDRALDEADDAFANRESGEPAWTYWLNLGEMDVMRARCMTELRRPLKAVPLLEAILGGYPAGLIRETALYQTWLGEAYAQANEIDAARETYDQAATLAGGVRSERLNVRLRKLAAIIGGSCGIA